MHYKRSRIPDGPFAIERFKRVEPCIHRAAALVVRGELPAAVTRRAHRRDKLIGRDEDLAAIVGIGFAVELLSKWAVGVALERGTDGHAAIEGQLESAELQ